MAHVLIIVAQRYNANELWPMLKELQRNDHSWDVVAYSSVIIDERTRKGYYVTKKLEEVASFDSYDGLVFVSGNPQDTMDHWEDVHCNELVVQAAEKGSPMAAICAAVPALGPALRKIKVSAYPLRAVREALVWRGAELQSVSLFTDGVIATAENEMMAGMWAENFRLLLEGKSPKHSLQPSPFKYAQRRMREPIEIKFVREQGKKHDESK